MSEKKKRRYRVIRRGCLVNMSTVQKIAEIEAEVRIVFSVFLVLGFLPFVFQIERKQVEYVPLACQTDTI